MHACHDRRVHAIRLSRAPGNDRPQAELGDAAMEVLGEGALADELGALL
jgi:hypothetical protein